MVALVRKAEWIEHVAVTRHQRDAALRSRKVGRIPNFRAETACCRP